MSFYYFVVDSGAKVAAIAVATSMTTASTLCTHPKPFLQADGISGSYLYPTRKHQRQCGCSIIVASMIGILVAAAAAAVVVVAAAVALAAALATALAAAVAPAVAVAVVFAAAAAAAAAFAVFVVSWAYRFCRFLVVSFLLSPYFASMHTIFCYRCSFGVLFLCPEN